jgi:sugar phosphate permease
LFAKNKIKESGNLSKQPTSKLPFNYAWLVLAVLFIGLLASFGIRSAFGAFITPWENDFKVDRTIVTSISLLSFIVYAFAQPLAGKLNDLLGGRIVPSVSIFLIGGCLVLSAKATHIWQMFVLYGLILSFGIAGCSAVTASAIISRWFKAKQGFAIGLAVSGMAVGQLIVVPAALFLINLYNWRLTIFIFGLVTLLLVLPLMFLFVRSKPEELGRQPYGHTETGEEKPVPDQETRTVEKDQLPVFGVVRQKTFWMLTIPYFICGFTDVGLINTHLIPLSEGRGFPVTIVALTFSIIAICNIGGTIGTGYLSDHFNRSRQLGLIYAVRAVTFIFLLTMKNPWLLIPFAFVYGVTEMASIAPTNSLTTQLFDRYSIGTILGFMSISHQMGGAIGSWVPGLLYDLTGSYDLIIGLSVFLLLGSALLVLRVPEPRNS